MLYFAVVSGHSILRRLFQAEKEMSLKKDPQLDGRLDTAIQLSSKRSTSLTEARALSSPDPQPQKFMNGESTNDEPVEPISIEDEEAQPNPTYVQGWKLHVLTLGYQPSSINIWTRGWADNPR